MTPATQPDKLPGLRTKALGRNWRHLASVDSTNDYLKRSAAELPHGAAVTASRQTAGKGRRGKQWADSSALREDLDSGLALSVLLHGWQPAEMALLPLLVGLGVCEGVEALCGAPCAIKWSNDVLIHGGKLCGILCESCINMEGGFAVAGIGVNLVQTREDFDRLGLVYANSLLLATGKPYTAPDTAAAVLNHLEPLLDIYRAEGFEPLRGRYKARCVTLGKPVRVLWEGTEHTGAALDIAPDGALLCEIDGAVRAITAGEASVRGLYGYA